MHCHHEKKCSLTGFGALCWRKDNDSQEWIYLEDGETDICEIEIYRESWRNADGFDLQAEYQCDRRRYSKWNRAKQFNVKTVSACWLHKCLKLLSWFDRSRGSRIVATCFVIQTSVGREQMLNSLRPVGYKWSQSEGLCQDWKSQRLISHSIHFWPLVEPVQYCSLANGSTSALSVYKTVAVFELSKTPFTIDTLHSEQF